MPLIATPAPILPAPILPAPILPAPISPATLDSQEHLDFDRQAALIHGWQQEYRQISPGPFRGKLTQLHCADVHLFLEHTGQALVQRGLVNGRIAIGVPLHPVSQQKPVNSTFCGQECNNHSLLLYAGASGFEFISQRNMLVGVIAIELATLQAYMTAEQFQQMLYCSQQAALLPVPPSTTQELRHFIHSTFALLAQQPELLQRPNFIQILRNAALGIAADGLAQGMHLPDVVQRRDCWSTVAAVQECMHQADMQPLSIASLCQQLGISRRKLQYHFEHSLRMSPLNYMRVERLNRVRKLLKTSNSVTSAATEAGFWHFGHFSQEYRKMFGELPSSTFRRHHGVGAA